jgi:agmatinase
MPEPAKFADANSDFDSARYVFLGAPYDATGTHRRGTGLAPQAMRKESWNFEAYLPEHDVDLLGVKIHDLGDLQNMRSPADLKRSLTTTIKKILADDKIPLTMGGEHSISQFIVSQFKDVSVLVFDAHLDFRADFDGDRNSHACASRRMSEIVGVKRMLPVGIRSICKDELADARKLGLKYITAEEMTGQDTAKFLKTIDKLLPGNLYISLDMDAIDPAYAPGVGTPEPFGLEPILVRDIIRHVAHRTVGYDLVEVCPTHDNGNTSALAARLLRDFIGVKEKKR